jgi:predicted ATP-dependent endonuclease of OLD family
MLIGKNNTGKSNVLAALRIFYEEGNLKFSEKRDFPKLPVDDDESWIEIHYLTTAEEQKNLKEKYQSSDRILKIRKYLKSKNLVKSNQSNLYAYEGNDLCKTLFYGAKNISQAKLGRIIYIPAVGRTEDTFKLTGPSPFRKILNFVMKRAVLDSPSFGDLKDSFENFNKKFKKESSKDGFSMNRLVGDINNEIKSWQVTFGIKINPIRPEDLVKNLLDHHLEDKNLTEEETEINSFGQGLQRHLIYTLIRLSSKYIIKKKKPKKEWSPDFGMLLFEEPEAYLHPSQQEILHLSLKKLAEEEDEQILISTHSPHFVSKHLEDISGIIRLHKRSGISELWQVDQTSFDELMDANLGLYRKFCDLLESPDTNECLKNKIIKEHLGDESPEETMKLEEESIKYFLWLNPDRSSLFFAEHVCITEGLTDKAFFNLILDEKCPEIRDKHIYILDSGGKFSIHRYIKLLGKLHISHSIILDKDSDESYHKVVNEYIRDCRNDFTKDIFFFPKDLESFLGVIPKKRSYLKPINVINAYKHGQIQDDKIEKIINILNKQIEI